MRLKKMKFAVFEFNKDKSCEVGESRWILQEDPSRFNNEKWDSNKMVMVAWPCGFTDLSRRIMKSSVNPEKVETETCVAKVIRFSGECYFFK